MNPSEAAGAFRVAVLDALGYAPEVIEPGRLQRFPTSEKHVDSAGWCKLFDDLQCGVFGCFRRGISETWRAGRAGPMSRARRAELARQIEAAAVERMALQRREWARNGRRSRAVWRQCLPLAQGDAVSAYLNRRGFECVRPLPSVLRQHPRLQYVHEGQRVGTFPAMVAPIVAPDGRLVALHRTYLTDDGCKADVPSPRKLTAAAGPLAGACIPLARAVRGRIGIAEGIETALAAQCASGVPTVASYSAANLAAWVWPADVLHLVIFADADRTGREAADALRVRALAAGLRVDVMTPTEPGADWCDLWAARCAPSIVERVAT